MTSLASPIVVWRAWLLQLDQDYQLPWISIRCTSRIDIL